MGATHNDILDLVTVTVKDICPDKTPDVRLIGNNIFIGNKPVPIVDIKAYVYSSLSFLKFIKEVM
jgi:hypothetical protein